MKLPKSYLYSTKYPYLLVQLDRLVLSRGCNCLACSFGMCSGVPRERHLSDGNHVQRTLWKLYQEEKTGAVRYQGVTNAQEDSLKKSRRCFHRLQLFNMVGSCCPATHSAMNWDDVRTRMQVNWQQDLVKTDVGSKPPCYFHCAAYQQHKELKSAGLSQMICSWHMIHQGSRRSTFSLWYLPKHWIPMPGELNFQRHRVGCWWFFGHWNHWCCVAQTHSTSWCHCCWNGFLTGETFSGWPRWEGFASNWLKPSLELSQAPFMVEDILLGQTYNVRIHCDCYCGCTPFLSPTLWCLFFRPGPTIHIEILLFIQGHCFLKHCDTSKSLPIFSRPTCHGSCHFTMPFFFGTGKILRELPQMSGRIVSLACIESMSEDSAEQLFKGNYWTWRCSIFSHVNFWNDLGNMLWWEPKAVGFLAESGILFWAASESTVAP